MSHTLQRLTMSCQNAESLQGTKGKTFMLQNIPRKRSLLDAGRVRNRVCASVQINVYQGKRFDPTITGTLQRITVVIKLMSVSQLLGKGFHVFADSFFASLNLTSKKLFERTYLTGTMKRTRPIRR